MLTELQGKALLKLARSSIMSCLSGRQPDMPEGDFLNEESGVFVTLENNGDLRGCIGFPEPVMPLGKAVVLAAQAAAFEYPRFPPLSEGEEFDVEISVLTKPELVSVPKEKLLSTIKVGKDGLIVRSISGSGLLLPQVATEQGWSSEEFMSHTCLKAGIGRDAWKRADVKVFKFQCQIFQEK